VKRKYAFSGGSNPTRSAKKYYNRHSDVDKGCRSLVHWGTLFLVYLLHSSIRTNRTQWGSDNPLVERGKAVGVRGNIRCACRHSAREPNRTSCYRKGNFSTRTTSMGRANRTREVYSLYSKSFRLILCICHWESGGIAPPFLITELDVSDWSTSCPGLFASRERSSGTQWMDPSLDCTAKKTSRTPKFLQFRFIC
jgi:hypothetical protein